MILKLSRRFWLNAQSQQRNVITSPSRDTQRFHSRDALMPITAKDSLSLCPWKVSGPTVFPPKLQLCAWHMGNAFPKPGSRSGTQTPATPKKAKKAHLAGSLGGSKSNEASRPKWQDTWLCKLPSGRVRFHMTSANPETPVDMHMLVRFPNSRGEACPRLRSHF